MCIIRKGLQELSLEDGKRRAKSNEIKYVVIWNIIVMYIHKDYPLSKRFFSLLSPQFSVTTLSILDDYV